MSGFGSNERKTKKSEEKLIRTFQRDKLISNAFSLHSSGKIMRNILKIQINIFINGKFILDTNKKN